MVRWGVLGTASIAVRQMIPAIQSSKECVMTVLASRDAERARTVAAQLGVGSWCGSYDELLQRSDVDAVYVPLPNHLHVRWSIRALEGGKHVLCEKPIGLNTAEAHALRTANHAHPRLKVMEAFMYRFHPQWVRAQALVKEGAIGTLHTVQTFFSTSNADPANIRNVPEMGGGALMDLGCYGISLSRFLYGAEPVRVLAHIERDSRYGVDRLTSAIMDFESGTAAFTCARHTAAHQRVDIVGTDGRIEIEVPFNAPNDRPSRIRLYRGDAIEELSFDACNQYTIETDLFANAIRRDSPVPTLLDDAVANMVVIDAVVDSVRTGSWVRMGN